MIKLDNNILWINGEIIRRYKFGSISYMIGSFLAFRKHFSREEIIDWCSDNEIEVLNFDVELSYLNKRCEKFFGERLFLKDEYRNYYLNPFYEEHKEKLIFIKMPKNVWEKYKKDLEQYVVKEIQ